MKKLILIHGALGSTKEFEAVIPLLNTDYEIHNFCIPGHNGSFTDDFNIDSFADALLEYLQKLGPSYIFGFSMGGYLALYAASKNHKNIKGIVTLGTKFNWSPESAKRETSTLNTPFLREKVPTFFEHLSNLHSNNLELLMKNTVRLMLDLGNSPRVTTRTVIDLEIPIIVLRGGKDKMVSKDESKIIADALMHGDYREIPFLPHPLFLIKSKDLARLIKTHIQALEIQTAKTTVGLINFLPIQPKQQSKDYTCLFLHEALGSIAQWDHFPQKVCDTIGAKGIIIEMPGYGFSKQEMKKRDSKYLHYFGIDVITAFREAVLKNDELLLIGHSDGGTEALLHSIANTRNLVGIVTMAAHIRNESETKAGIPPAIAAFNEGKLNALQIYHAEKTASVFNAWSQTWLADFFANWDITEDVHGINIPGLIVQGSNDQYGTAQQVIDISKCFNHSVETLILPDCGHAPHLEKEAETIQAIETWSKKYQL